MACIGGQFLLYRALFAQTHYRLSYTHTQREFRSGKRARLLLAAKNPLEKWVHRARGLPRSPPSVSGTGRRVAPALHSAPIVARLTFDTVMELSKPTAQPNAHSRRLRKKVGREERNSTLLGGSIGIFFFRSPFRCALRLSSSCTVLYSLSSFFSLSLTLFLSSCIPCAASTLRRALHRAAVFSLQFILSSFRFAAVTIVSGFRRIVCFILDFI